MPNDRPAGPQTPSVTLAPAGKYIVTAMQGNLTAGNIGPSATPAVPPTPTSVVVGPETGIPLVIAPTIRVTPTSVEEARAAVLAILDGFARMEYPPDAHPAYKMRYDNEVQCNTEEVDELIAAVRAEEREKIVARDDTFLAIVAKQARVATLREVREMVEGMIPAGGNGEDAYALCGVLAELAKMETP